MRLAALQVALLADKEVGGAWAEALQLYQWVKSIDQVGGKGVLGMLPYSYPCRRSVVLLCLYLQGVGAY